MQLYMYSSVPLIWHLPINEPIKAETERGNDSVCLMHMCVYMRGSVLEAKCSMSTKSVVRASGAHLQLITPTSLLIKSLLEVEAEKLIKLLSFHNCGMI